VADRFDPATLIQTLLDYEVDFVLIGGVAGNLHGSARITADLDVAYARDPQNLERLARMLLAVHATLRGAPKAIPFLLDAETLAAGQNFTFDTDFGAFDMLGRPEGAPAYSELVQEAPTYELGGQPVRVASLDHLIRMKEAAGRPQDKLDAATYRAIADEQRRRDA